MEGGGGDVFFPAKSVQRIIHPSLRPPSWQLSHVADFGFILQPNASFIVATPPL
jgi:hypothetical protein